MKAFILFITLVTISLTIAPNFGGVNQNSRLDLTKAIVLDQSFQIDKYISNTIDWSIYNGHYYSNKAPGGPLLAVIPFYIFFQLDKIIGDEMFSDSFYLSICIFFTTILPFIAILFLTYSWLNKFQISNKHKNYIIFLIAFGNLGTIYSTMLWGHITAAFFIFGSFYFYFVHKKSYIQGLFFGLAVLTEYSSALLVPVFIYLNYRESKKEWLNFILGGLIPFLMFIFYHKSAFGGFFNIAPTYGNPEFGSDHKSFLSVLHFPSMKVLYELFLGFKRGIFIVVPISAMAFFGLIKKYRTIKSNEEQKFIITIFSCFILFLFFNITFLSGWHGGWSSGPRYLVPIFPLL